MKNWRTTLTGWIGGLATALIPVIQGHGFQVEYIVVAATLALLGSISKDFDTTGAGTSARKE